MLVEVQSKSHKKQAQPQNNQTRIFGNATKSLIVLGFHRWYNKQSRMRIIELKQETYQWFLFVVAR